MTERDAFEARFAAAVLGYTRGLSSELDPVELAHRIAVREPRRHGLSATLALRGLMLPAPVWVLLLLVALLTGLVAGMLAVGSRPAVLSVFVPPIAQVFTCPAGAKPDEPGPPDQARPAGLPTMAFDARAGKLVGLLNGVGGVNGIETWTFDVCTNTWTQMHPPVQPVPLGSFQVIYDADSDETIALEMGRAMWAYDLSTDTWTQKGTPPIVADQRSFAWTYDSVSGLVLVVMDGELWSYDAATDSWSAVSSTPWSGWAVLAHDASVDRLVAYTRTETWLFDTRTGTWSRSPADMPEIYTLWGMNDYGPQIVYDAAARRTVVAASQGGIRIATYDATADRWTVLFDVPDPDDLHPVTIPGRAENEWEAMVFDSVNQRLIGVGRFWDPSPDGRTLRAWELLAFDTRSGTWTVLVDAR